MAIQICTNVLNVKIEDFNCEKNKCSRFDIDKDSIVEDENVKYLKFYTSIIGENTPYLREFDSNYIGDIKMSYRYDWLFGISCIPETNKAKLHWDWKNKLRNSNSIKIQLLFELNNDTNLFFHIISANLLCLNPSKDTSPWYEKSRDSISNSLNSIANITKDYSKIASDVFNVANTLTNFIPSDDNDKNWYLYKFLDQEKNCFAIEWHINKKVIEQFGPMLQGSIVTNFYGTQDKNQKLKLKIRPFISFTEKYDLCYLSPYESLKYDQFIEIEPKITPPPSAHP